MPGTISPWPVVQNGNNGHPIRTLQFLLRAHGQLIAVDGLFGPVTEAAVSAFQTSKGLPTTGIVNAQTWVALIVEVRRGSTGDAVRGVQEEFQFRNLSGDPNKGLQVDGGLRAADRHCRTRLSARPLAGYSIGGGGRDRWPGHLAGVGERHVIWLGTPALVLVLAGVMRWRNRC